VHRNCLVGARDRGVERTNSADARTLVVLIRNASEAAVTAQWPLIKALL